MTRKRGTIRSRLPMPNPASRTSGGRRGISAVPEGLVPGQPGTMPATPGGPRRRPSRFPAGTGRRARGSARPAARARSQASGGSWSGARKTSVSTFRDITAANGADWVTARSLRRSPRRSTGQPRADVMGEADGTQTASPDPGAVSGPPLGFGTARTPGRARPFPGRAEPPGPVRRQLPGPPGTRRPVRHAPGRAGLRPGPGCRGRAGQVLAGG